WFSLCVAIGVVSYLIVPFLRDIAVAAGATGAAATLETGPIRLAISLAFFWTAALGNLRGVKAYERLIVPLMFLTFLLGGARIVLRVGCHVLRALLGCRGSRRALEVHRLRRAASRPDGARPSRLPAAAGVDGGDRLRCGRLAEHGSTRDAARGTVSDVRVGRG